MWDNQKCWDVLASHKFQTKAMSKSDKAGIHAAITYCTMSIIHVSLYCGHHVAVCQLWHLININDLGYRLGSVTFWIYKWRSVHTVNCFWLGFTILVMSAWLKRNSYTSPTFPIHHRPRSSSTQPFSST